MQKNIVLRFRDLIVTDTIQEHRDVIRKKHSVWWGWWSKPIEKISIDIYSLQNEIKTMGSIYIYLIHSGTFRLYKSKCIEIDIDEHQEPKECRDIAMVPEYYFTKECKVWFRFESIIDANPEELNDWVYDDPEDFICGDDSDNLHGMKVSNIKEMLHRHRTIYFITPYDKKIHSGTSSLEEHENSSVVALVDKVMHLVEEINKVCDYAPRKASTPIQMPKYSKELEQGLKNEITDSIAFRDFSSNIYKLLVDGHKQLMNNDRAIIKKYDFLNFAGSFIKNINLFRCDLHHSFRNQKDKQKVGSFYKELCGTSILDDADKMSACQHSILTQTVDLLKKELSFVKQKIDCL